MQRVIIDVEDRYINLVINLLSNLKQNVVKNITIEKEEKSISNIDKFHKLRDKSNNKTELTMQIATDSNEMVNDGIF